MLCVVFQVLVSNGEKYECGSKNPFAEGNENLASTAYRWASALKLCLFFMYFFTDSVFGALCLHTQSQSLCLHLMHLCTESVIRNRCFG